MLCSCCALLEVLTPWAALALERQTRVTQHEQEWVFRRLDGIEKIFYLELGIADGPAADVAVALVSLSKADQ